MSGPCPRCGEATRTAAWLALGDGTARLSHRRAGGVRCSVTLPLTSVPAGATLVVNEQAQCRATATPPEGGMAAVGVRGEGG